jgi:hypothetical protein
LYENFLFYPYWEVVLLIASALALHCFLSEGRQIHGFAFFAALCALALMRSLFHLFFLLLLLALLVIARPELRRRAVTAAALPLFVVLAVYVKNFILFKTFGGSTWFGPSLGRVTTDLLSPEERAALIARGELSGVAAYGNTPVFVLYSRLPQALRDREAGPKTSAGVLDAVSYTSGYPNFNYRGYLSVYKHDLDDALWVIRHRPTTWLRGWLRGLSASFYSSSSWFGVRFNAAQIKPLVLAERVALGQIGANPKSTSKSTAPTVGRWRFSEHAMLLLFAYVIFATGIPAIMIAKWERGGGFSATDLTLIYMYIVSVFVVLVSSALDLGENNRFRFCVDPLVIGGLAVLGRAVSVRLRHLRASVEGFDGHLSV